MRFAFYENHNEVFERKWKEFLKYAQKKNNSTPQKPGSGWLKKIATDNDYCSATWKEHGDYIVCAAPLWDKKFVSDSAYLCRGHRHLQKKEIDKIPRFKMEKLNRTDYDDKMDLLIEKIKSKLTEQKELHF